MDVIKTDFKDLMIIQPKIFEDNRGYFAETFNKDVFKNKTGLDVDFVQDNESESKKNVLRGLHFQTGDFPQAKLVRVVSGSVLDVVVDLRENSKTFMEHFGIILDSTKKNQLFVPRGFAHSFLTLSEKAIFSYKCDNYYNKDSESGIHPFNNIFNIDWGVDQKDILLSEKDNNQKSFYNYNLK